MSIYISQYDLFPATSSFWRPRKILVFQLTLHHIQSNSRNLFNMKCGNVTRKIWFKIELRTVSYCQILYAYLIMPPFEEEGVYCFANVGR